MQRRARARDLTPEESATPGASPERHSDVQMMFEIIRIADAGSTEPDAVCEAAVRALAKATEYRGRPVQLDL